MMKMIQRWKGNSSVWFAAVMLIVLILGFGFAITQTLHAQVNVRGKVVNATQGFTFQDGAPAGYTLCGVNGLFTPCPPVTPATLYYQTVAQDAVSNYPQRSILSFDANFVVADSVSSNATLIHLKNPISVSTTGRAGIASTADALTSTPIGCPVGQYATGITSTGNSVCTPLPVRTCNGNGCYLLLTDGTIEAWGQTNNAPGGGSASYLNGTFPITINNPVITVTAVNQANGDGNPHPISCSIDQVSGGGFRAILSISTQVSGSGYGSLSSAQYCSYHVFGNQ